MSRVKVSIHLTAGRPSGWAFVTHSSWMKVTPSIGLREETIFAPAQKCPYHVSFDLDLEHTLDAGSPGDHPVQVWSQSGYLPARRSDFRKKFTDRRTDKQTDKRQTPRDCISSWNLQ